VVFASLTFLYLFLPLQLALYFCLRQQGHRNALLIVFSLAFYAWGEPVWLSLLLLSSVSDWLFARFLEPRRGTWAAKALLASSLTVNLALLASFKYADLITNSVNAVTGLGLTSPGFSLPIGISFYTFQTMSYVIDVYRGEARAQQSFGKFLLFVSLFHQLVAGPIVRYVDIAHEIDNRVHTRDDFARGVLRLCIGLWKKVCLANVAGELVKQTLDGDLGALAAFDAWFGIAMYTLQIYFDFSGYSDMAIGLGLMAGFHYKENFHFPYISTTVTEFWRRWHMSLGSFFRDYVYIPLGGKERWAYRNLFVVWGLTGLWHGASWNFLLWGLYYGVLIALERLVLRQLLDRLPAVVRHSYLLAVVVVGWALFYFTDFGRLGAFFVAAAGQSTAPALGSAGLGTMVAKNVLWLVVAVACCTPWPGRALFAVRAVIRERGGAVVDAVVVSALSVVPLAMATAMLVGNSYNPFLYVRF